MMKVWKFSGAETLRGDGCPEQFEIWGIKDDPKKPGGAIETPKLSYHQSGLLKVSGLSVTGQDNPDGAMTIDVKAIFKGMLSVSGETEIQKKLTVGGDAEFKRNLVVGGDVRLGAGDLSGRDHATRGLEKLRVLRGRIDKSGTVAAGKGFTCAREKEGVYAVTFDTEFSDEPTVVATQQFSGTSNNSDNILKDNGGNTRDNAVVVGVGKNKFLVRTGDADGNTRDRNFEFIVAGPC